MKKVLISIHPYYVFLIIAKAMGWNIDNEKTIEVRKTLPKAEDWDKLVEIYCSRDKKSFNLIPEEYQPLMQKFLSKVVGRWYCDKIDEYMCEKYEWDDGDVSLEYRIRSVEGIKTGLDYDEIREYGKEKSLYFWHISKLKIYDKPKELSEFYTRCNIPESKCKLCDNCYERVDCYGRLYAVKKLTSPPQSWCYVEE